MIKILKQGIIVSLLAAHSAAAPAAAQAGAEEQPVRTTTNTLPGRVPTKRPVQSTKSEKPKEGPDEVKQMKVPKSIKAAYYCTVDLTHLVIGSQAKTEQRVFTISALSDGSLVYGGKDALDSLRRFSLVDEGEWRVMTIVGWIEGKDSSQSGYLGTPREWSVPPRIHRVTGEFSAQWVRRIGPLRETHTYSGSCNGGV